MIDTRQHLDKVVDRLAYPTEDAADYAALAQGRTVLVTDSFDGYWALVGKNESGGIFLGAAREGSDAAFRAVADTEWREQAAMLGNIVAEMVTAYRKDKERAAHSWNANMIYGPNDAMRVFSVDPDCVQTLQDASEIASKHSEGVFQITEAGVSYGAEVGDSGDGPSDFLAYPFPQQKLWDMAGKVESRARDIEIEAGWTDDEESDDYTPDTVPSYGELWSRED